MKRRVLLKQDWPIYNSYLFTVDNDKYTKSKYSYGIACCRINDKTGKLELLLVRKSFTYAFNTFVCGRYTDANIADLLSNMTIEEKKHIRNLAWGIPYESVWYLLWNNRPPPNVNITFPKQVFENYFGHFKGRKKLLETLDNTPHILDIWDIPKGHRNRNEEEFVCAKREFMEETNLSPIKFLYEEGKSEPIKREFFHIDEKVRYCYRYYIAIYEGSEKPNIKFNNNSQMDEINELRWMTLAEIYKIDQFERLVPIAISIIRAINKYNKRRRSIFYY